MGLDIRIPIGMMFGVIGIILTLFGLISDARIYERSLGINMNLIWGLVLVAFGGLMLAMAYRASRRRGPPRDA
jgi:hypothetical protein